MIDLGLIPPAISKAIWETYYDMNDFTQEQQGHFYEMTAYNGRSIQFTLNNLYHDYHNKTTDEVLIICYHLRILT